MAFLTISSALVGCSSWIALTFNLGILQGLSRLRVLDKVDYLSSVSGGGYIHQFLAAWLRNYEKYAPASKKSADILEFVEEQLTPLPQETGADHQTEQPEPVRWLRRYSNYLTPRTGLLSADTWVVAAIWLRNTFLNQLVLIASLAALLAIPDLFTPTHCSTKYLPKLYSAWDFAIPATGIVILAGFVVWRSIVLLATRQTEEEGSAEKETGFFCGRKVVPGLLMAVSILASPVVYRSTFPNVSMVTGPSNEPATENAQGQLKAGDVSLSITLTAKQENGTKAPGQVDSHGLAGCGGPAGKRRRQRSAA